MPTMFISYRRKDTLLIANLIWERLKSVWGEDAVIKDTDNFLAGVDFREQMSHYIQKSDVVFVLIGDKWLETDDVLGKSRLFKPNDPVRIEIEEAITYNKIIIPVLINDRKMPELDALPDSIKEIVYNNALRVHEGSAFVQDVDRLNGYLVNPELLAKMGKNALPPGLYVFKQRRGFLGHITSAISMFLCFLLLAIYWLVIGYTTPWLFPPEILRISGSNYLLMKLWGNDAGLEKIKVVIVVSSLIIDWLIIGKFVSLAFHDSLFPIPDFVAATIFGSVELFVSIVLLLTGLRLREYKYVNVINLRKTFLVVTVNSLLTYGSSFRFLGVSYMYFPILASVLSTSLFAYTLIGIGLASYKDNLYGINRVLEYRTLRQERATLISKEYREMRRLLHEKKSSG